MTKVKRYLVFTGDQYYPWPGWNDFYGAFDLLQDAVAEASMCARDWWHVVDLETLSIVEWGPSPK